MVSGLYISTKTIPLSLRQIKHFLGGAMPQNTVGHDEVDLILFFFFFYINLRSKGRAQNSQGSQSEFLSRRH